MKIRERFCLHFRTLFGHIFAQFDAMNTKKPKFPMIVKRGSCAVKIYRDQKPQGTYFRVAYHLGGKRHRLNFRDLERRRTKRKRKPRNCRAATWTQCNSPAGIGSYTGALSMP